jgi:hypothetical protein
MFLHVCQLFTRAEQVSLLAWALRTPGGNYYCRCYLPSWRYLLLIGHQSTYWLLVLLSPRLEGRKLQEHQRRTSLQLAVINPLSKKVRIYGGANEIMKELIARDIVKK